MRGVYLNETVMLVITASGVLSLVVLLGTWAYSGSPFPSEPMSDGGHAALSSLLWLAFVLVLIATAMLWGLRILATRTE